MLAGNDEMPRFGRLEGRIDRRGVFHLADHDDVGVLPQRGVQPRPNVVRVHADLPLGHRAVDVAVQKLDRVLERHDVLVLRLIDVVDDRRHGRAPP